MAGSPVAKVIHNFGRADKVDKVALAWLASSISRILDLPDGASSAPSEEVEIIDSRRLGGTSTCSTSSRSSSGSLMHCDQLLWATARRRCRRPIYFSLVAQRCLKPGSKLAAVRWANERVAISSCPEFDGQAAYAATDSLLVALPEIPEQILNTTAKLLNLAFDITFVDTTSTYFERDVADGEANLEEWATRRFKTHSKVHRPDLSRS